MRQCLLCSRQYEDDVQFCPHDGAALPPPDQLVGQVVDGKYHVDALQGSGGMGAVYRATQINLERAVAIKVVRGDFLKDPVIVERFKREALAVARLKHPHIVTVYDFGLMADGGAYLVMEFLEGRTLREELHARGRVPLGPAVDLMAQICSAVAAAHAEEIIHRDLKPDNVFLERRNDGSVAVKILDFGVAKLRQNTAQQPGVDLTMGGMMVGTPLYMSPEQCQGETLDARSDIYALGCLFYEMLAGRPPFTGGTATQVVAKHVSEQPKQLATIAPWVPADLSAIVMRALEKSADDRFQFAADLGAAISAVEVPLETQASFPAVTPDAPTAVVATGGEEIDSLVDRLFSTGGDARTRVAVLPFRNLAGAEEVDFLGLSLADAVITELSSEPGMLVRPTTAVEPYRETTIDQLEVSRALDVQMLVTGSFLKQGDALQVSAQLVDVGRNEIVWRHRSTESSEDLLALQDALVEQVTEGIRQTLQRTTGGFQSAGLATPTPAGGRTTPVPASGGLATPIGDPVAQELLAQASELGDGAADRRQAIEILERAVGLDPDLAAAWSSLAARYESARDEIGKESEYSEKAIRAAERALVLDRGQLGSVVALGRLLVESGRAEDVARRAAAVVEESPESVAARFALGYAFRFGGLVDRALREFRIAEQFDAGLVAHEIATIYLQKGLPTDALRVLHDAGSGAPRAASHFVAAVAWSLVGDAAGVRDATDDLARTDPESVYSVMARVLAARLEGGPTDRLVEALQEVESPNPEVACWIALVCAFTGDTRTAASSLERAVAGGYFNYPHLAADPMLETVRDDADVATALETARVRHEQFASAWAER